MNTVDLSKYDNSWYDPGSPAKRMFWGIISIIFFQNPIPWPSEFKAMVLRAFGARIGTGVVIKPLATIKYPWLLAIGNNSWIGEDTWLDNLAKITIGSNVCVSQRAHLLTGNHNYKKDTFDLIVAPITVEDGSWIGAGALICPGVNVMSHSVISAGGVLTKDTEPYTIYSGNPALPVRKRVIE